MPLPEFARDPDWRREVWRDAFGPSFRGFLLAAVFLGIVCWLVKGGEAVRKALGTDLDLLGGLLPRVIVALSVAALVFFMLPRDRISGLVGQELGFKGILVATAAGTVTPGGPSSAFALLSVLGVAGADRGAMVAYITAWATLGLQRVLVWDVPFMGAEFAILRLAVSLPVPILAGLLARRLPLTLVVKDESRGPGDAEARP